MKIYVIQGTTGEYSDRDEWLCFAVNSEARAKEIVEEYTREAKAIEARTKLDKDHPDYLYPRTRHGEWPHPDPKFGLDYTGTDYCYAEIELRNDQS